MEENKMVNALEKFVIHKVTQMQKSNASPEELEALAELVKAVNQSPRTIQALGVPMNPKEFNKILENSPQLDVRDATPEPIRRCIASKGSD